MAQNSKIEWCDATWNPVTGCTPISAGCANCYAKNMARRFPFIHGGLDLSVDDFSIVYPHYDRLDIPLHWWKKPRRIFVCSMGDLFHDDVPFRFIAAVYATAAACPEHTFLILTKRPQRARDFYGWVFTQNNGLYPAFSTAEKFLDANAVLQFASAGHQDGYCPICKRQCRFIGDYDAPAWPLPNVWLGVTAENQEEADRRIPILLQIPAEKRFVSIEPMLGTVDLSGYFGRAFNGMSERQNEYIFNAGIDWVICGGENGSRARPVHPDWVRSLRDQCVGAGVPFFFKGWGEWLPIGQDDLFEAIRQPDGRYRCYKENGRYVGSGKYFQFDSPESKSVIKLGKKISGRLLDEMEWNEFPV